MKKKTICCATPICRVDPVKIPLPENQVMWIFPTKEEAKAFADERIRPQWRRSKKSTHCFDDFICRQLLGIWSKTFGIRRFFMKDWWTMKLWGTTTTKEKR